MQMARFYALMAWKRALSMVVLSYYRGMDASHSPDDASDGMRQSPLGERHTLPTLGPSGIHERLNCWAKKRRQNVLSHFSIVSVVYVPSNAFLASRSIRSGEKP